MLQRLRNSFPDATLGLLLGKWTRALSCLSSYLRSRTLSRTPIRSSLDDLLGLLIFLRYEPFWRSSKVWNQMLARYPEVFRHLFSEIALRHSKDQVRAELQIPSQTRLVIRVPFTHIEEQRYSQLYDQMCAECGLDRFGSPLAADWDPNSPGTVELMRTWLTRLRETCLHPLVGAKNRRALGGNEGRPLRTVNEGEQISMTNTRCCSLTTSMQSLKL